MKSLAHASTVNYGPINIIFQSISRNKLSRILTTVSLLCAFLRGDLDLELMKKAAQKFKGEHDFRNFCCMDVANGVVQFFRRINNISLNLLGDPNNM